jgi:hypothetical protein
MITDIQTDGKSLVSPEDRERYERLATRAADRYHAKVEAMLGTLVEDEEDEATLSGDEEPRTTKK